MIGTLILPIHRARTEFSIGKVLGRFALVYSVSISIPQSSRRRTVCQRRNATGRVEESAPRHAPRTMLVSRLINQAAQRRLRVRVISTQLKGRLPDLEISVL